MQVQNEIDQDQVEEEEQPSIDPWSLYLYAMKYPVTREKYAGRLSKFLEYSSVERIPWKNRLKNLSRNQ